MNETMVKDWIHALNNKVGAVLGQAEMLRIEGLPARALERTKLIEEQALEIRRLIRQMTDHLLG
jgi:hypothetical protein